MKKYLYKNILTIILILISFSLCLNSQTIDGEMVLNNTLKGINETAPFMQLGNDGTIYVSWIRYTDMSFGDIYFAFSTDNGNTFSAATKVTENGKVNGNFQRGAKFVIDKSKNLHMVWLENKINNQTDVWYSQSTDNGINWSHPRSIMDADDSMKYIQDFCDIAIDSSNIIYVSFLDTREEKRKLSNNLQLYLTTSLDMGITWSDNRRVSNMPLGIGGTCECCSQSIEVSPEGNIYIAFRTNINDRRDIFLARSLDKGLTFEETFPIQNGRWTILACPVTGPKIVLDKMENLHCVWFDDRDDSPGAVYYAQIPYGTSQTPENIRLSKGSYLGSNYPDVSLTNEGKIAIAYQTANQNIRYYFGDEPKTGSDLPINNINSQKSFVNIIAKNNDEILLCWQDSRDDAGDIYFKKMNFNTSAVFENNFDFHNDDNLKELFSKGQVEVRIFDMLGNLKFRQPIDGFNMDNGKIELSKTVKNFSTGMYLLSFSNGKENYSKLISIVK